VESGDLVLVSQISVHGLVLRFNYFHFVSKQTNKKSTKTAKKQNFKNVLKCDSGGNWVLEKEGREKTGDRPDCYYHYHRFFHP
jgi:hypothetical protein